MTIDRETCEPSSAVIVRGGLFLVRVYVPGSGCFFEVILHGISRIEDADRALTSLTHAVDFSESLPDSITFQNGMVAAID